LHGAFHICIIHLPSIMPSERETLFKKSALRNDEFERYLSSSEPASLGHNMNKSSSSSSIVIDSTRGYVIPLPLSYFVADKANALGCRRNKGKADAMPFESFRFISVQHRGGNAHSLVLIKSRAIRSNPHHIAIFESNGRNKFCGIRILDDHQKNVTKAYTTISPEYNINYGSDKCNPGYCGIYSIICVVAFRHYRSKTGTLWLTKWMKLMAHMSQCIDRNSGCLGVELAARVQEIIATSAPGCAEREIADEIRACIAVKHDSILSFVL